jgi:hypothetical protein
MAAAGATFFTGSGAAVATQTVRHRAHRTERPAPPNFAAGTS